MISSLYYNLVSVKVNILNILASRHPTQDPHQIPVRENNHEQQMKSFSSWSSLAQASSKLLFLCKITVDSHLVQCLLIHLFADFSVEGNSNFFAVDYI